MSHLGQCSHVSYLDRMHSKSASQTDWESMLKRQMNLSLWNLLKNIQLVKSDNKNINEGKDSCSCHSLFCPSYLEESLAHKIQSISVELMSDWMNEWKVNFRALPLASALLTANLGGVCEWICVVETSFEQIKLKTEYHDFLFTINHN